MVCGLPGQPCKQSIGVHVHAVNHSYPVPCHSRGAICSPTCALLPSQCGLPAAVHLAVLQSSGLRRCLPLGISTRYSIHIKAVRCFRSGTMIQEPCRGLRLYVMMEG